MRKPKRSTFPTEYFEKIVKINPKENNRFILKINKRITGVSSILDGPPYIIKVMLLIITIFNLYKYIIQKELCMI